MSDETRQARIHLRLTQEERDAIARRAEKARMTMTAYLLACALGERHDPPNWHVD